NTLKVLNPISMQTKRKQDMLKLPELFLTDFEFFNIQVFEFTNEALRESSGSFSMYCFRFVCILIGFSTFQVFAFVVDTELYVVIAVSFFNFLLYYYVTCCFYYCYWNQLSVFTEN